MLFLLKCFYPTFVYFLFSISCMSQSGKAELLMFQLFLILFLLCAFGHTIKQQLFKDNNDTDCADFHVLGANSGASILDSTNDVHQFLGMGSLNDDHWSLKLYISWSLQLYKNDDSLECLRGVELRKSISYRTLLISVQCSFLLLKYGAYDNI